MSTTNHQLVAANQALEVQRVSASPLIVVLDPNLPQLDGVEVLRMAAEDPSLAGRHAFILLTAITGQRFQEAKRMCDQLMVPVIPEPLELDSILGAVAAAAHSLPSNS